MARLCLMIEGQEGVAWGDWLALADATERLGFDGLFTSDHYGAPLDTEQRDALDVWAVLAALGPRTSHIRLGTMVSPVTFRPPAVLAKLAVTVDQTSGGRVEVGMGAGWHEREHAAFGFPFPPLGERLALLEEQIAILRALFDDGELDHHGAHYALDACVLRPRPLQPRLPIILGGGAKPRGARLAAAYADEYNVVFETPDATRAAQARLDAACEAIGRDPRTLTRSLMTRCVVGATAAELDRRLRRVAERAGEDPAAIATSPERDAWIVGTPDEVLERIARYQDAGVERFMLQHLDHTDLDMLDELATAILPHVA